MAYCATVSLHDEAREKLHTIRYARMPQSDPTELAECLQSDVFRLLERRPDLKVCLVADGAEEMWNVLETHLNKDTLETRVDSVLDFYHLIEKLGAAAHVVDPDNAAKLRGEWKDRLLKRANAAEEILREIEASGLEDVAVGQDKPVRAAITYIRHHKHRMHYARALRRRLPIGSGNVEASCKSLVEVRMKRSGSRWKEASGQHILQLRALATSDRWDSGMKLALKTLRRAVRRAA